MKLHLFSALVLCLQQVQAWCIVNTSPYALEIFDRSRSQLIGTVDSQDDSVNVCSDDMETLYYGVLQPGQKACWFQGGTGGYCNPEVFIVAPASNLGSFKAYNARQITFLSGDGVIIDYDTNTAVIGHNSVCTGVQGGVRDLEPIDTSWIFNHPGETWINDCRGW
jgi:hypothetical protein